jgi:hypothetical protein
MHVVLGLVGYAAFVSAHEHHDEDLPPGQVITFDPVDSILWTHIFFMTLSFGVLFPTGMARSLTPTNAGPRSVKVQMARLCSNPSYHTCE